MKQVFSEKQFTILRYTAAPAALCLILFAFTGCSNLFSSLFSDSDDDSSTGSAETAGTAVTVQLSETGSTGRAAYPSITQAAAWTVRAVYGTETVTFSEQSSLTYTGSLAADRTWIITAQGYADTAKTACILYGTKTVTPSSSSGSITISVGQPSGASGTGSVSLSVNTSSLADCTSVAAYIDGSTAASGTFTPSSGSCTIALSGIANGRHTLLLKAYNSSAAEISEYEDTVLYVWADMVTNVWHLADGSTADTLSLATVISLYVSGSSPASLNAGSDTAGNGTLSAPFATLTKALALCTDASASYKLYADGSFTENISTGSVTLSITGLGSTASAVTGLSSAAAPVITTSGTLTLKNLTITNGTGSTGAGICANGTGTLTVTDCTVTANTATTGGGIYIGGGTAVISGTTVSSNTSSGKGGAVYLAAGTLSMDSSTVLTGNSAATYGSALYAAAGTVRYGGGSITGNKSDMYGAVYIAPGASFTDTDGTELDGSNALLDSITENLNLKTGTIYYASGDIVDGTDSWVRITAPADTTLAAASGGSARAELNYSGILNGIAMFGYNSIPTTGTLYLGKTTEADTWPLSAEITAGTTLTLTIQSSSANYIQTLNANASSSATRRVLTSNCTHLKLKHITLTGGYAAGNGGALYIAAGKLTLKAGCTITGNYASYASSSAPGYGGGIYLASGTSLIMDNGTVSDNTAVYSSAATAGGYGGGIYAEDADVTINGGEITGNTARSEASSSFFEGGGGICFYYSTSGKMLTITGGTVSDNTACRGAGILMKESVKDTNLDYASLVFSGGTIKNNTATNAYYCGGGIYTGATTTMTGGSITANKAPNATDSKNPTYAGGGLYIKGTFKLSGGTISGNSSGSGVSKGAVYDGVTVSGLITYGDLELSGDAAFSSSNDIGIGTSTTSPVTFYPIKITGALTQSHAATLTPADYTTTGTTLLTGSYVSTCYSLFTVTSNSGTKYTVDSSGTLQLQ